MNNLQHSFDILQVALVDLKRKKTLQKTRFMLLSTSKELGCKSFRVSTVRGSSVEGVSDIHVRTSASWYLDSTRMVLFIYKALIGMIPASVSSLLRC